MIKKTITYKDFNDVKRTEDYYFNLTKAELTDLQLSAEGGLDVLINRIIKEQNITEIMRIFKLIIQKSYGIKSDDGKHFRKSDEIFEDFANTNAYDELLVDIISSPESAEKFIEGILPAGYADKVKNQ